MKRHPTHETDIASSLCEPLSEGVSAEEIQFERFRKMSPTEKLQASLQLYYSARELKAAWVRSQSPLLSEEEVRKSVKESFMYARS